MEKRKKRVGANYRSSVRGQVAGRGRRKVRNEGRRTRGRSVSREPSTSSEDFACRCHPEADRADSPVCAGCTGRAAGRAVRRKPPRVPPPECDVWPEEYRGENWKPAYAFIFEGKCQLCAHSCPLPKSRQRMDKFQGNTRLLHCTNHPGYRGQIVEVLPTDTCRNFKPKCWKPSTARATRGPHRPVKVRPGQKVERIPLGDGIHALIDAADYPEISKYRWYAKYEDRNIYAMGLKNGRWVYMHRVIVRPRRGYVVDHKDGNGLNNCRDNLRACTQRQNQVNRRSYRGVSRFVGVYRCGNKWKAGIGYRGKMYYLGVFDDEVQAAKARDRKAWELHGEFAYLNFPEDYAHKRRRKPTAARGTGSTRRRQSR